MNLARRAAPALALVLAALASAQQPPLAKKLIEYGWDVPNPAFVREHIRDMEKRPFDGLIFRMEAGGQVFMKAPWADDVVQRDYANLQAIEWGSFTDNFLATYAASDVDWFSDADFAEVCKKAAVTAHAAKLGRCKGVCFDFEPYGTNPWEYPKQAHAAEKTFAEYEAQVRKRGAEFMAAMQTEMPEMVFHTFFLLSYFGDLATMEDIPARQARLSQHGYALLPAFVNGLLDAAGPGIAITDGNESSYYYNDPASFYRAFHAMRQTALGMVAPRNTAKYQTQVQAANALYVDYVFKKWPNATPAEYLSDEERAKWFEHNVYYALTTSDRYVWLYSEKMNWWTNTDLPPGLEEATRSGRRKAQEHRPLGFDIREMMEAAAKRRTEALQAKLIRRRAEVARLPEGVAPAIDGDLSDAAWEKATALEPFVPYFGQEKGPEAQTHARVACDAGNLYLAIRCDEPKMAGMNVVGEKRDDSVWMGDSVDIFIAPAGQGARHYHLIVSPKDVIWDAVNEGGDDLTYDPEWQHATEMLADGWTVEAAIPWAALKATAPAAGTEWRANLGRQRAGAGELSTWSQCVSGFVEPESFGTWKW
jgi:Carbohydrate family 9 binding domain-like